MCVQTRSTSEPGKQSWILFVVSIQFHSVQSQESTNGPINELSVLFHTGMADINDIPPTQTQTRSVAVQVSTENPNPEEADTWASKKKIFQKNVFTNLAVKEGSSIVAILVLVIQIVVPALIIVENAANIWDTQNRGIKVPVVSSLLLFLLWCVIISDTRKSADGFDCIGGLKRLPRLYWIQIGLILTVIVNPLSGVAAFFLILRSESVQESALNALALFFINRLDEDTSFAGTVFDILRNLCTKGVDGTAAAGLEGAEEDEKDAAERYLKLYGPWEYNYHIHKLGGWFTCTGVLFEFSSWGLSLALPLWCLIHGLMNLKH
jgi:hypothetical protein